MGKVRGCAVVLIVFSVACSKPPAAAAPAPLAEPVAAEVPAVVPDPPDRQDLARQGLFFLEEKNYPSAIRLLTDAAGQYPEVAPFLLLRVMEAELALGNAAEAARLGAEIAATPDSSAATIARLRLPQVYAQLGDTAATEAAFADAMTISIDELTEAEFAAMASALARHGRADLAASTRMRLLNDYTGGRLTEQTFGLLRNEIARLPTAEKLALAGRLARANRYDQALELFAQIPGTDAQARPTRLRALFNSRNYTQLLEETKNDRFDDPALVLLRARAAWRDDHPAQLLSGLAEIEKRFPSSPQAAEAKIIRAKYYITDVTDHPRAIDNLEKALAAGAAGSEGENLWNLGWTHTLAGNYDKALATYARYVKSYPDGDWKTNSLFWSAKIHDRFGREAERDASARQLLAEYPHSYYAWRIRELWPSVADEPAATTRRFPDHQAALAQLNEPRLATVRELQQIGLHRAAAREMKAVAAKHPKHPGVQFMLADVYVEGGEPFKANGVLQREFRDFVRHGGQNIPKRFWQILYPLAYWETLQTEARRRELDPYLLASITRQESGFEPSTVSNAGAVGLMQIMPEEASRIAAAGGLGEVTRQDLFDPVRNIAVGAAEYSQKLQHWKGNHVLAIASYNAGEGPVGTWIERTPIDDLDLFVESIPYAETRLYVKTVTRNRFEYRRIYERDTEAAQQQSPAP